MANTLFNHDQQFYHVQDTYEDFMQFINTETGRVTWSNQGLQLVGSFLYFKADTNNKPRLAVVELDDDDQAIISLIENFEITNTDNDNNEFISFDNRTNKYIVYPGNIKSLKNLNEIGGNQDGLSINAKNEISVTIGALDSILLANDNNKIIIGNPTSEITIGGNSFSSLVSTINSNYNRLSNTERLLTDLTNSYAIDTIVCDDLLYKSSFLQEGRFHFEFAYNFNNNGASVNTTPLRFSTTTSMEIYRKLGASFFVYAQRVYDEQDSLYEYNLILSNEHYRDGAYISGTGVHFNDFISLKLNETSIVNDFTGFINHLDSLFYNSTKSSSFCISLENHSNNYDIDNQYKIYDGQVNIRKYGTIKLSPVFDGIIKPTRGCDHTLMIGIDGISGYETEIVNEPIIANLNTLLIDNVDIHTSVMSQVLMSDDLLISTSDNHTQYKDRGSDTLVNLPYLSYNSNTESIVTTTTVKSAYNNGTIENWRTLLKEWVNLLQGTISGNSTTISELPSILNDINNCNEFSSLRQTDIDLFIATFKNNFNYASKYIYQIMSDNHILNLTNLWKETGTLRNLFNNVMSHPTESAKRCYPLRNILIGITGYTNEDNIDVDKIFNGTNVKFSGCSIPIAYGFLAPSDTLVITPELAEELKTKQLVIYVPTVFWSGCDGCSPAYVLRGFNKVFKTNEDILTGNTFNGINDNFVQVKEDNETVNNIKNMKFYEYYSAAIRLSEYLYNYYMNYIFDSKDITKIQILQNYPGMVFSQMLYALVMNYFYNENMKLSESERYGNGNYGINNYESGEDKFFYNQEPENYLNDSELDVTTKGLYQPNYIVINNGNNTSDNVFQYFYNLYSPGAGGKLNTIPQNAGVVYLDTYLGENINKFKIVK